jgi:hypothetical protein
MEGQWVGRYPGNTPGTAILHIDHRSGRYEGDLVVFQGHDAPIVGGQFVAAGEGHQFDVQLHYTTLFSDEALSKEELARRYPEKTFASYAFVKASRDDEGLRVEFTLNNDEPGTPARSVVLTSLRVGQESQYVPSLRRRNWDRFRRLVNGLEPRRFVFRGQSEPWPLQTSFHRHRRWNLFRYMTEDIPDVHRALAGRSRHSWRLDDPNEYAAFLNLIQHHGYPTPLLDWSESPFVAAYFAFRSRRPKVALERPVRIFMFDLVAWRESTLRFGRLGGLPPHVTFLHPLTTENERAGPQQSLVSVTNVDDIEAHIRSLEELIGRTFLQVIDLPFVERPAVLRELTMMGLTEGTLFPGLDGACSDLRARHFGEPP